VNRLAEVTSRPATATQDRNTKIERLLKELVGQKGVTAAALVDSDGLVTHAQRDFDLDIDALGAAVQITFGAAHTASGLVRHGLAELIHVETKDGYVMLAPLHKGFTAALVADRSAMLGVLRLSLKQTIPLLNDIFV
jgi:predicted regulator of Ras-like GTPase activity (Roadblock/LC7/MglB family)